jgi:hypothetical protein
VSCGPIQFVSQVTIRAEKAVADAKLQRADKYAPYEYYGAEAFLEQAMHRASLGDFQTSYRYGKRAEQMANKAAKLSKQRKEEEGDVSRTERPEPRPSDEATPPRRQTTPARVVEEPREVAP